MNRYLIPLGIFIVVVIFLGVGLKLDPKKVPSPLIGKPAPAFTLPLLHHPDKTFSPADMKGKVWLLNVWASWCAACRIEHPVLVNLARKKVVPIYGLNYKDERQDAQTWLKQLSDPYVASAHDLEGKAGIDWGVYGVPETFVIDKQGLIRHKHIGPVSEEDIEKDIMPLLQELEHES